MLESHVKDEYTRLLFAFYGRAQILGFPFALFIFLIFYGKANLVVSLVWLFVIFAIHGLQMQHAKRFFQAQRLADCDYQRWNRDAVRAHFVQGIAWASVMFFMSSALKFEYFLVSFFLMTSVLAFSASGYSRMLLAYAIPVFVSMAISGYIYFHEYRYLSSIAILGIFVFYMISQTFEKTLLESIKIRFENQELLHALNVKKEEAEQANRSKSVFLASASHDLRQPLHAIGLYLGSLTSILNTNEQKLIGSKIAHSVEALTGLFDSILDISKLDSGIIKPAFETISLEQILTRVRRNFESAARDKGLTLSEKITPTAVRSDPILLERIISNLLSNAVRYTAQGEIKLVCSIEKNEVVVEVEDSGIGIPSSEIDRIFAEFYQLNNPERDKVKGLGLGLSIVRRLCDLLGHNLSISSIEGVGTKFSLRLPLRDLNEVNQQPIHAESALNLANIRVIVVDDDKSIRESYTTILKRWQCSVYAASGCDDAMQIINSGFTPDLIISDYRLENLVTGVDVISAINDALQTPVPAILVTGDTSPELLLDATNSGHTVLHKPVIPGELRKAIAFSTSGN